jgi:hypothetical protein
LPGRYLMQALPMLRAPVHASQLVRSAEPAEPLAGHVSIEALKAYESMSSRQPHPELPDAPSHGKRPEWLAVFCWRRDKEDGQQRVLDCVALGRHARHARQDVEVRRAVRIRSDPPQVRPHPSKVLLSMSSSDDMASPRFVRKRRFIQHRGDVDHDFYTNQENQT